MLFPPVRSVGGFGGRPLKNASGAVKVALLTVTNAQFNNMFTSPVTLVAAPSSSLMIVPVRFTYMINITVAYGTFPTLELKLQGISAGLEFMTGQSLGLGSIQKAGRTTAGFATPFFDNATAARYPGGKALQANLTSNPIGGTVGSLMLSVAYYLSPVP